MPKPARDTTLICRVAPAAVITLHDEEHGQLVATIKVRIVSPALAREDRQSIELRMAHDLADLFETS